LPDEHVALHIVFISPLYQYRQRVSPP
jgi:hypothetical protein